MGWKDSVPSTGPSCHANFLLSPFFIWHGWPRDRDERELLVKITSILVRINGEKISHEKRNH